MYPIIVVSTENKPIESSCVPFFSAQNIFGQTAGLECIKYRLICLRNKSWKPECVLSFNMGWQILVYYPEPEARDNIFLLIGSG